MVPDIFRLITISQGVGLFTLRRESWVGSMIDSPVYHMNYQSMNVIDKNKKRKERKSYKIQRQKCVRNRKNHHEDNDWRIYDFISMIEQIATSCIVTLIG